MTSWESVGSASSVLQRLRAADALFYVDDLETPVLGTDDEHHALDVLRLSNDATVAVSDGAGSWRLCRVRRQGAEASSRRKLKGDASPRLVLESITLVSIEEENSESRVSVGFALQKGDRSEWAVQKLTELGVDVILPFTSVRTVVRIDEPAARRRGDRFRKIAREAAAQSRRTRLPVVRDPASLVDLVGSLPIAPALAEPGANSLAPDARTVFVGPEGGFTSDELALASSLIGLGPTVLRSETAAVVAGTLLVALRNGLVVLP